MASNRSRITTSSDNVVFSSSSLQEDDDFSSRKRASNNLDAHGDWRIEDDEIQIGEVVGMGKFGVVHEAKLNGEIVALKRHHDFKTLHLFEAELEVMKELRHPSLVQLIGYVQEGGVKSIVMEILTNGSVEDYVKKNGRKISLETRHKWCIQMAQALAHLHNMEPRYLIHRDVKPANFMLNSFLDVKLGDFGVSRLFAEKGPEEKSRFTERDYTRNVEWNELEGMEQTGNVGSPRYMAPEIRQFTPETAHLEGTAVRSVYSVKSDVFSLGMVYYFVFEGTPPSVNGSSTPAAHFQFLSQGQRPVFSKTKPGHRKIIDMCWTQKPLERPTSEELVRLVRGVLVKRASMTLLGRAPSIEPTREELEEAEAALELLNSRKIP